MRIILVTSILIFACCCQQKQPFDKQKTAKEVKEFLNEYLETIREEGLAAEFNYLDTTDRFFWVPPGFNQYIEIDSVKRVVLARADFYQKVDNRWEYLKIDVLTNDHVFYTGKLDCNWIDSTGLSTKYKMLETGLVIRTVNGWKITGGQSTMVNN